MKAVDRIKKYMGKIKNPFFRARCKYIKYYDTLLIDPSVILLESQHGKEISGNIFYIAQYIANNEQYRDYKVYIPTWIRHRKKMQAILNNHHISSVQLVVYASDEYFRLLASAKYLINDNTFDACFIKKEGQIYLNTWHGTPLKTLGRKMNDGYHSIGNVQKNFAFSDYMLFPNRHTRDALLRDYMVEDISNPVELYGGYPRNSIFFDEDSRKELRERFRLEEKKVYAYLPTFRGMPSAQKISKNDTYLLYFLYELDRLLNEDEILYVNLHPVAKKNIDFRQFRRIKAFPINIETYAFLNLADCLITDYSSVFFDFANTRRKIVLFAYDQGEYLEDRGVYIPLEELPFSKVNDINSLLRELRSPIEYDDKEFLDMYCPYETTLATQKLCDFIFFQKNTGIIIKERELLDKENILLYVGNLAGNGITASLKNLLNTLDLEKRNYYLAFRSEKVARYKETLQTFPEKVKYFSMLGDMNLTLREKIIRKFFKGKVIPASFYMKLMQKRIVEDWQRCFGRARFHTAVQFNGYEAEFILLWSQFMGNKVIYSHSDMLQEIQQRKNQRKDVLQYAYQTFSSVAVVSEGIRGSVEKLMNEKKVNVHVIPNVIDWKSVLQRAQDELIFDPKTTFNLSKEEVYAALSAHGKKFINVARFSPEKGQKRLMDAFFEIWKEERSIYLFILGGSSFDNTYQELKEYAASLETGGHIILIKQMSNPFPLVRQCDYFVLSSFYEGFGLVIAEADILKKPVISTDIAGPRIFMQMNGGTIVENSMEGLKDGMRRLLNGEVPTMDVNYEMYNREAVAAFEKLL